MKLVRQKFAKAFTNGHRRRTTTARLVGFSISLDFDTIGRPTSPARRLPKTLLLTRYNVAGAYDRRAPRSSAARSSVAVTVAYVGRAALGVIHQGLHARPTPRKGAYGLILTSAVRSRLRSLVRSPRRARRPSTAVVTHIEPLHRGKRHVGGGCG